MMNVPVLLLLCVPTLMAESFVMFAVQKCVYFCCKDFFTVIFAECFGAGAHYPGEVGVLEHPT